MTVSEFQPDWHETEEAVPLVYLMGKLSLEWNMVEQFQTSLMWKLLGGTSVGMAVTGNLGNRPKQAIIIELAEQRTDKDTLVPLLKLASRNFSALQENRNVLIHSHSIFRAQDKKPEWRKATGRGPNGHISTFADEDDLEKIISQIVELGQFFIELVCYLSVTSKSDEYELAASLSTPLRLKLVEGDS